ncbi:hypothetical protein AALP_AA7G154900 [Arabis alpina]|uniref:Uncharacterized protein n=1 Tax=Arabis alpina TaxID=50452 RepID=A0A087GI95_ARAAL|nr:hypothetical protein AALP_AA7G154900 [Arabis alpina]
MQGVFRLILDYQNFFMVYVIGLIKLSIQAPFSKNPIDN